MLLVPASSPRTPGVVVVGGSVRRWSREGRGATGVPAYMVSSMIALTMSPSFVLRALIAFALKFGNKSFEFCRVVHRFEFGPSRLATRLRNL